MESLLEVARWLTGPLLVVFWEFMRRRLERKKDLEQQKDLADYNRALSARLADYNGALAERLTLLENSLSVQADAEKRRHSLETDALVAIHAKMANAALLGAQLRAPPDRDDPLADLEQRLDPTEDAVANLWALMRSRRSFVPSALLDRIERLVRLLDEEMRSAKAVVAALECDPSTEDGSHFHAGCHQMAMRIDEDFRECSDMIRHRMESWAQPRVGGLIGQPTTEQVDGL